MTHKEMDKSMLDMEKDELSHCEYASCADCSGSLNSNNRYELNTSYGKEYYCRECACKILDKRAVEWWQSKGS